MSADKYKYFILTKQSFKSPHLSVGCLLYVNKSKLSHSPTKPPKTLPVNSLASRSSSPWDVELNSMQEISVEAAETLLAVPEDAERLKVFTDRDSLRAVLGLSEGSAVTVKAKGETMKGIIRYIGKLKEPEYPHPISPIFFGIELQGKDRGMGESDGSYRSQTLFHCDKDCGLFAPVSRVKVATSSVPPPSRVDPPLMNELTAGDRVTYFVGDKCRHGMVVEVQEDMVRISTDTDEKGQQGGEVEVHLDMVVKGEVPADETEKMDIDISPLGDHGHLRMVVNSLVEVTLGHGNAYGIIRWMGKVPGREETTVGLELEDDKGVSDGTFKGQRLFTCPSKRALFVRLSSCRPDSRFHTAADSHDQLVQKLDSTAFLSEAEKDYNAETMDTAPPVGMEQIEQILVGRMKGIQGHCNSCYMDAALFGLFSCSSVLDSMLFKSTTPQDAQIQRTLLHDIVVPLRSKGFVEARHVMRLRQQLQKHGYSHSFTTDEKDPEEFLIVIMHHILALDPLLKLSADGKVQESYCYQIFLDQNHKLVLPTVQQLLEHSLHSGRLKLAEVPSCLILQMPRFGKKFKMFDKIIPSLELDITDLLCEGPQQCMVCGNLAVEECTDCFKDPIFSPTGFKVFCKKCSAQVHSHPQRRSHQRAPLEIPQGYMGRGVPHCLTRDRLELFAVLCIETSHYVSFVKYGPKSHHWIFFDSMADRQGETDGFNIPEVQTCPEVGTYLEMSPAELANQVPRDMRGVAKRLFCDAYMYLYQSTSMSLYR